MALRALQVSFILRQASAPMELAAPCPILKVDAAALGLELREAV